MTSPPTKDSKPTRILIVDDHGVVRLGCAELLSADIPGTEIAQAKDATSAIDALMNSEFDLVILDINLPGRNGFDVLREAHQLHPGLPVLILSAYPEGEFAIRAFKLGAAGYLSKQAAPDELAVAAQKVLGGGKYVSAGLAEQCAAALGGARAGSPHEALSARELQVLQWIAKGRTLKEIAAELSLSDKTIATYRARIARKMDLSSNIEITRYALQHKLVD